LPPLLTSGASLGKTANKRLPAKTLWAHDQAMVRNGLRTVEEAVLVRLAVQMFSNKGKQDLCG
ncbi:hypothetical protein SB748_34220, partial [Rhizobium sp. SIMBA_035]